MSELLTINDIASLISDFKSEVQKRFDALPESMQKIVQDNYNSLHSQMCIINDDINTKLDDIVDANRVRDSKIESLERLQLQSDLVIQGIPKTSR